MVPSFYCIAREKLPLYLFVCNDVAVQRCRAQSALLKGLVDCGNIDGVGGS
ncbi:Hypothetical predicted protein, partial [Olea europaea subsp. europaea]